LSNQNIQDAPALKDIFNAERIHHIADEAIGVFPAFNRKRFLALTLNRLNDLSLMARLRLVAESLHAVLPGDYCANLSVLRDLAPRLNNGFVTMALPEYVALYGADDFSASMEALKFFTTFGSSEFAIRHFLRRDFSRTLLVMTAWSQDENEHVRRLASEGSRPRLPWSFLLPQLVFDPSPLAPILDNLKADPSPYVRRSVANCLNDITKDNPEWALKRIENWPLEEKATAWIAKHALRSLIKKGDRRALAVIGAGETAEVTLHGLKVTPKATMLGERITISFELRSTSDSTQRLVVDYAIHYVKSSGAISAKVFKLKTLTLHGRSSARLSKTQLIANFTTRTHYAGRHDIDIFVNGQMYGRTSFDLQVS